MKKAFVVLGQRCPDWLTGPASRKVDEDEASHIYMKQYFVETVLLHVEADGIFELGSFNKLAHAVVLPTVVLA